MEKSFGHRNCNGYMSDLFKTPCANGDFFPDRGLKVYVEKGVKFKSNKKS